MIYDYSCEPMRADKPPKAEFKYEGSQDPTAFNMYKSLIRKAGRAGFEVVPEDFVFSQSYDYTRASDKKNCYEMTKQEILDAVCADDFSVIRESLMHAVVRSRKAPHIAYLMRYTTPTMWELKGDSEKRLEDGQISILPVPDKFGDPYKGRDETFAYEELERLVKYKPVTVEEKETERASKKEAVSKIGRGENSGTNFRPVRKNR